MKSVMSFFGQFSGLNISRRPLAIAAVLVGTVSLAIGAHAALNKRTLDVKATAEQAAGAAMRPSRIALVIGNGHYPDAGDPLSQPINDARAVTAALHHEGFDVDVIEDASHDDMTRAVDRLKSKVRSDSVVMLFFGGYGIQVGRESFMIPVDAAIWKESDVRREGVSVETVLDAVKDFGASAKLVVLDASRRNPYERRFRLFSHGLAPISMPDNALVLTSASPNQVVDDSAGANSVLVTELLGHINDRKSDQARAAEAIFNQTRIAISRASGGAQVPSVSSSLMEDVSFNSGS
jgi:Caspase domain